jgi:diguanylate cyclase (GGDEF)-like protein
MIGARAAALRGPAGVAALRAAGFTALYAVAIVVGRATHPLDSEIALVWPAAGIGVWWLMAARSRRELVASAVAVAVTTAVVNTLTGVPQPAAVAFGPVNAAHALVGFLVLERLLPGRPGLRTPGDVSRVLAAAAAATAVSATASALTARALLDADLGASFLLFGVRNLGTTFAVVAAVLAMGRGGDLLATWRSRGGELLVASAVSAVAFYELFGRPGGLPLLFLSLLVPVWFGTRLGVSATALAGTVLCVLTVSLTIQGWGAFGEVPDPATRAVLVQAFIVVLTLVGLSLATLQRAHDDVTRRLEQSRRELQDATNAAVIGKAVVVRGDDGGWTLTRANPALVRLLGADPTGRRWGTLLCPDDAPGLRAALDRTGDGEIDTWEGEVRHCLPDDTWVWTQVHLSRLGAHGPAAAVVAQLVDVTERRAVQEQLARLATLDPLTGLVNRTELMRHLDRWLAGGTSLAVVFVDLDGFKAVNDTFGHAAGDTVLVAVAGALGRVVRPQDLVCRLGGDEFVVVCPGVPGPGTAAGLAGRFRDALPPALLLDGTDVGLGASAGWTLSREDDTSGDLLRRADAAMYAAKRAGKGRVHPDGSGSQVPAPASR